MHSRRIPSGELSNEIPAGDDPDLTRLTVEAAIGWVNQATGDERDKRFQRVLDQVMTDRPDPAPEPPD